MSDETGQKNKYLLFTVGAIGTFMATLDGSIVNVALPTISADLNAAVDKIAWVAISYSLTLISLMLIFGVWVDKKGYYFAYKFGYSFFIIGSILCVLASNFEWLIFGRVIQAIGTSMFVAIGPGMVTTVFGEKERGKGIGLMVMMVAAGFMVGPPLGGFLLNYFNWPSLFVINIPIGFLALLMTFLYFKNLPQPKTVKPMKIGSALSMSISLVSFTSGLSFFNDYPVTDFRIWGLVVVSIISIIFFIRFEMNAKTAIIGLDIFRNKQFTSSVGAMLFMFTSLAGISILIPFYLENIRDYQPNEVGLFLIIFPIMMFVFAPISGRLSDKIGYRFLTISGLVIQIIGYYLLSNLNINSPQFYIIICFVTIGAGTGIFNTPNSSALMGSVTEEFRGVTSSILGTTRNIGMSFGVALSTTLFTFYQTKNSVIGDENIIFVESFSMVTYVSIAIAFISLIFSMVRDNKPQQN